MAMPIALLCLLGFTAWTMLLMVLGVGVYRWSRILSGCAGLADFPSDEPHGPAVYRRIVRAHANCVENLPLFAVIVLVAAVLGRSSHMFDNLAVVVVAARIGQTTAHISSGSGRAVAVRFTFFALQLVALAAMLASLVTAAPN